MRLPDGRRFYTAYGRNDRRCTPLYVGEFKMVTVYRHFVGSKMTLLETLYVMLVTFAMLWVTNIIKLSKSQSFHQQILSPTSVTNIHVAQIPIKMILLTCIRFLSVSVSLLYSISLQNFQVQILLPSSI